MGRLPRNQEEAFHHVTSVGNRRENIFIDDLDRVAFLRLLEKIARRYEWLVGSYSLLGNHNHLSGLFPQGTVSLGMHDLNGAYSKAFNGRWRKTGHLFQERFDDRIVENGTYLLTVIRYDVWNPVRHGFVVDPADWRWSSYLATAGLVEAPAWLRVDLVLREFSPNDAEARRLFREFVAQGQGMPSPWVGRGSFLGSDSFCDSMTQRMKEAMRKPRETRRRSMAEIVDAVAFALDSTVETAKRSDIGRKLVAYLAIGSGVGLGPVAEVLGCSLSTASRAATCCENLVLDDGDVNRLWQRAKERLAGDDATVQCLAP